MIGLTDDRAEALNTGFLALADRNVGLSFEQFETGMAPFEVQCLKDGEKPVGLFANKGPEIHVAIIPGYRRRWISKGLIDRMLMNVVREYGYASTSVMRDNLAGQQFVKRLGFHCTGSSDHVLNYQFRIDPC